MCADEEVLSPSSIESMIQLNPYAIQAGPLVWKADYLVGVATRKNRRHRGYMRQLLVRMMGDMRREGMPFCFLMPAAEAIYRPFAQVESEEEWSDAEKCGRDDWRDCRVDEPVDEGAVSGVFSSG